MTATRSLSDRSAKNNAVARTRTWDHLVNSEVLYQLSYDGSQSFVSPWHN